MHLHAGVLAPQSNLGLSLDDFARHALAVGGQVVPLGFDMRVNHRRHRNAKRAQRNHDPSRLVAKHA